MNQLFFLVVDRNAIMTALHPSEEANEQESVDVEDGFGEVHGVSDLCSSSEHVPSELQCVKSRC